MDQPETIAKNMDAPSGGTMPISDAPAGAKCRTQGSGQDGVWVKTETGYPGNVIDMGGTQFCILINEATKIHSLLMPSDQIVYVL